MKKLHLIVLLIIALSFQSCKKYDANGKEIKFHELYKANWLLGNWEKADSTGVLKEIWIAKDDSTYSGQSIFIINKKDTVHKETIELMQNGEFLIYSTTINGENHNQPISFQLLEDTDSLLVFENKKVVFPQKIQYKLLKDSNIIATISGVDKGKKSSQSYPLSKVK